MIKATNKKIYDFSLALTKSTLGLCVEKCRHPQNFYLGCFKLDFDEANSKLKYTSGIEPCHLVLEKGTSVENLCSQGNLDE